MDRDNGVLSFRSPGKVTVWRVRRFQQNMTDLLEDLAHKPYVVPEREVEWIYMVYNKFLLELLLGAKHPTYVTFAALVKAEIAEWRELRKRMDRAYRSKRDADMYAIHNAMRQHYLPNSRARHEYMETLVKAMLYRDPFRPAMKPWDALIADLTKQRDQEFLDTFWAVIKESAPAIYDDPVRRDTIERMGEDTPDPRPPPDIPDSAEHIRTMWRDITTRVLRPSSFAPHRTEKQTIAALKIQRDPITQKTTMDLGHVFKDTMPAVAAAAGWREWKDRLYSSLGIGGVISAVVAVQTAVFKYKTFAEVVLPHIDAFWSGRGAIGADIFNQTIINNETLMSRIDREDDTNRLMMTMALTASLVMFLPSVNSLLSAAGSVLASMVSVVTRPRIAQSHLEEINQTLREMNTRHCITRGVRFAFFGLTEFFIAYYALVPHLQYEHFTEGERGTVASVRFDHVADFFRTHFDGLQFMMAVAATGIVLTVHKFMNAGAAKLQEKTGMGSATLQAGSLLLQAGVAYMMSRVSSPIALDAPPTFTLLPEGSGYSAIGVFNQGDDMLNISLGSSVVIDAVGNIITPTAALARRLESRTLKTFAVPTRWNMERWVTIADPIVSTFLLAPIHQFLEYLEANIGPEAGYVLRDWVGSVLAAINIRRLSMCHRFPDVETQQPYSTNRVARTLTTHAVHNFVILGQMGAAAYELVTFRPGKHIDEKLLKAIARVVRAAEVDDPDEYKAASYTLVQMLNGMKRHAGGIGFAIARELIQELVHRHKWYTSSLLNLLDLPDPVEHRQQVEDAVADIAASISAQLNVPLEVKRPEPLETPSRSMPVLELPTPPPSRNMPAPSPSRSIPPLELPTPSPSRSVPIPSPSRSMPPLESPTPIKPEPPARPVRERKHRENLRSGGVGENADARRRQEFIDNILKQTKPPGALDRQTRKDRIRVLMEASRTSSQRMLTPSNITFPVHTWQIMDLSTFGRLAPDVRDNVHDILLFFMDEGLLNERGYERQPGVWVDICILLVFPAPDTTTLAMQQRLAATINTRLDQTINGGGLCGLRCCCSRIAPSVESLSILATLIKAGIPELERDEQTAMYTILAWSRAWHKGDHHERQRKHKKFVTANELDSYGIVRMLTMRLFA